MQQYYRSSWSGGIIMKRTYFLRTILVPLFCLLSVNSVTSCDNISGTWVVPYEDDGTLIGEEILVLPNGGSYQLHVYNDGRPVEWKCFEIEQNALTYSLVNLVDENNTINLDPKIDYFNCHYRFYATCGNESDYVTIYTVTRERYGAVGQYSIPKIAYYGEEMKVGQTSLLLLNYTFTSEDPPNSNYIYGSTFRIIDGAEHVEVRRNKITALSPGTFTVVGGVNGFHTSEPRTYTIVDNPTYPGVIIEDIDLKITNDKQILHYGRVSEIDDFPIKFEISNEKYRDYVYIRLVESECIMRPMSDIYLFPTFQYFDHPEFVYSYQISTFVAEIKDVDGNTFTSEPVSFYYVNEHNFDNKTIQIDIEGPVYMEVLENKHVNFTIYPYNGYAYLEFECLNDPDAFVFTYNRMTALKAGEFDVRVKAFNNPDYIETEDTVFSNIIKVYVTE